MKQKDKKKIVRNKNRFHAINIPDLDILDDELHTEQYKSLRTGTKSAQVRKNNLSLLSGRILEIKTNYHYIVDLKGEKVSCSLGGRLRQYQFGTKALTAVGDFVEVDISTAPRYRIENVMARKNTFSRFSEGQFQKEIILAANLDQIIITASWKMPNLKLGLVDRYICIARIFDVEPIVCLTKLDLCTDRSEALALMEYYQNAGIKTLLTSVVDNTGIEELKELLKDKESVFSGQSGTGKSSLINWLEPALQLATAEVSSFNEKGKHTTTQSILIPWSFGGYLVDTPGLKTINLHRDHKDLIPQIFPGFEPYAKKCYFRTCTHDHEEDCAVKNAVEAGNIPEDRHISYLRIMDSLVQGT
ncbi:MAG: ribosome small subunit-dependent GTPase A [Candidatus Cloacimonetes bacterium]|nr:ribosome small subunit-dependent GTPase A [Candidatus Cloacimonadota bacterium]